MFSRPAMCLNCGVIGGGVKCESEEGEWWRGELWRGGVVERWSCEEVV
jgi:hypothetical protein